MTERCNPSQKEITSVERKLRPITDLTAKKESADFHLQTMHNAKIASGADEWLENAADRLQQLFPNDTQVVELMIREGIRKDTLAGYDLSLESAFEIPSGLLMNTKQEEAVPAHTVLYNIRSVSEITQAQNIIDFEVNNITDIGKDGLNKLYAPRNKRLKELEKKMESGKSDIDDWISFQMLRDNPSMQPNLAGDPFEILFSCLAYNTLPCQLEKKASMLSVDAAKNLYKELNICTTSLREYATAKGIFEGISYVLGEDNMITELIKEKNNKKAPLSSSR